MKIIITFKMPKTTIKQLSLDTIAISNGTQSIDIPFDDALHVASELKRIWQTDYDSLPFSDGVNQMNKGQLKEKIGINVRNQRGDFTQLQVAERLDIHRESVTQIENGKRNVSAVELFLLADFFGCEIDDFFEECYLENPI